MLTKIAAFAFGILELLLLLRLGLPYFNVPATLRDWVPPLIKVTDTLMAPFGSLSSSFDLQGASQNLGAFGGSFGGYANQLDSGVLVAMVGWGIVGGVVILVLSLVSRVR
jgi:hypothetical protein